MAEIVGSHGGLNGVIHSAGVLRDSFVIKKTEAELRAVLAPKVAGLLALDAATRDQELDFFVLFSSLTAVFGNVGQADYAAANGFMDAYAAWRDGLVACGERSGRTLSLNWPLWAQGGMQVDGATLAGLRRQGLAPLASEAGLEAFVQALAFEGPQIAVLYGARESLRHRANLERATAQPPAQHAIAQVDPVLLEEKTVQRLKQAFAEVTKLEVGRVDAEEPLESYGIDSIMITQLNQKLGVVFEGLSKTLFFEHRSLAALAGQLARDYAPACVAWTGLAGNEEASAAPAISLASAPVTAGCASSSGLVGAWEGRSVNLLLLSALAADTLRLRRLGSIGRTLSTVATVSARSRPSVGRSTASICLMRTRRWRKARATANGAASSKAMTAFDPLFFNISPREAEMMDPQERLFLQACWEVLEDAGYTRRHLVERHGGRVGVFAGITKTGFELYGPDLWRQGEQVALHTSFGSVANRVSYLFDLRGPSMPIDTMCSASLTAVHEACEHLLREECELALAGGVNLYVHPSNYVGLCASRMLSVDGQCRSFGAGGNGFVPGEGVGAVLLKPLSKAEADGDQIYGVIKGSAINHGGKTNGYTVPNPQAQAELIGMALKAAQVHPRSISYIEAHGTGTALGDPIEIAGLSKAFSAETSDTQYCAIGSAKSNIGHCESAAGIAGLTKVLLQMRHGQLVPSLHSEVLNPNIDFATTPFVVQRQLCEWTRPVVEGREEPRMAGISSFGAGGSNAHVIVSEYIGPSLASGAHGLSAERPAVIVLSARNAERLGEQVRRLLAAIESQGLGDHDLVDLAYTLQVGREAMEVRLGLTAASLESLRQSFISMWRGRRISRSCIGARSSATRRRSRSLRPMRILAKTLEAWVAKGKFGKLLDLWVKGLAFDWSRLYGEVRPRRLSLPTYPFARERYWLPATLARTARQGGDDTGVLEDASAEARSSIPAPDLGVLQRQAVPLPEADALLQFEEVWAEEALAEGLGAAAQVLVCLLSDLEQQHRLIEALARFAPDTRVVFATPGSGLLETLRGIGAAARQGGWAFDP